MSVAIDRLRSLLERAIAGNGHVSERAGNYFFDDDTAAFAEILVSGPGGDGEPRIAVIPAFDEPKRSFAVRIWRYYVPEVWLVDCDGQRIEQVVEDAAPRSLGSGDVLSSTAVDGLTIVVSEVFQ